MLKIFWMNRKRADPLDLSLVGIDRISFLDIIKRLYD